MKLLHCLDLTYDIILSQKLEKPIISLFLDDFDLTYVFHIWIDSNPKYWIVIQNVALENILCLSWEVFELKLIHFEFPSVRT